MPDKVRALDGSEGQRIRAHRRDAAGRHGERRDGCGAIEVQTEASLKRRGIAWKRLAGNVVMVHAVNSGFSNAINGVNAGTVA
ncbi:hypothetical protein [Mesorhizobium sp. B4-1-4]|uniref:hypothetical protein n=1 Tax=Mesorhizobium sp. B4-1-4 TaxID=2589888 RepID=UPI0015E4068E|nr:hypothetical protein [Mesorhizobium sp. B4-1-4]UCI29541.1 hypothetical protein FJW03_16980 [Mesorhizobium sp. B4-1-4]